MQPWTEEEKRNLQLIGIDPVRTERSKLMFLIRHFMPNGSCKVVAQQVIRSRHAYLMNDRAAAPNAQAPGLLRIVQPNNNLFVSQDVIGSLQ